MPPNTRPRRFPRPFLRRPAPALLLLILVAACVQPAVPTDRYYRMVVTAPEQPLAKHSFGDIIVVERPSAEGLLISRPILYVDASHSNELREYPYDYWAESPAIMIRNELVRCLEGVGAAPRVLSDDLRVNGDHSVVGSLQRLEHMVGPSPKAVIEIRLGIVEDRGSALLHWRLYYVEAAAADDSVNAAADAFSDALSDVCRQFTADIASDTK